MNRSDLLDADQLSQVLATTRRDLFRMETLPAYDVPINGNDLQRWLAGEPEPTWANKQPWLDTLARWAREGRPRRRVRVIHDPPTDYERYACDWGYRLNEEAGENIRVLDLAETGLGAHVLVVGAGSPSGLTRVCGGFTRCQRNVGDVTVREVRGEDCGTMRMCRRWHIRNGSHPPCSVGQERLTRRRSARATPAQPADTRPR